MPALDDDARCRARGVADLSRDRRRAGALQEVQVSRGRVWADVCQVSIGRGGMERQNITLRRRDDAGHALRSSSEHAAFEEMVMAQGLGDADRQAPRDEKGDRGPGAPAGRDHTAYGLTALSSAGPGTSQRHDNRSGSNAIGENSSSTKPWKDVPRGPMDEVSSHVRLDLSFV